MCVFWLQYDEGSNCVEMTILAFRLTLRVMNIMGPLYSKPLRNGDLTSKHCIQICRFSGAHRYYIVQEVQKTWFPIDGIVNTFKSEQPGSRHSTAVTEHQLYINPRQCPPIRKLWVSQRTNTVFIWI